MLQSKKFNMVIAIVAAVCMWAYVTGAVDPTITKRFADIPVQLINQDSLIQNGLAVDSTDLTTIDVNLEGDRADINKISASDIKVTADLYGRHKGSNYVNLDIQLPRGISLESRSEDRIMVAIDDLVTEDRDVNVRVTGDMPTGTTLGESRTEPDTVAVYGTENNVNKVERVDASLNVKVLSEEKTTHEAPVSGVDESGNNVPYVTTSVDSVRVTANLEHFKSVSLEADITGSVAEGYELGKVEIPNTIEIQGPESTIKNIESVTAQDIDISGLAENTKVRIKPILPEGVTVRNGENIYADIAVIAPQSQEFTFASSEINIEGLGEGLTGEISGNVNVSVRGSGNQISSLKKSAITLRVSAQGLEAGTHTVEVIAEVRDGLTVEVAPASVTLTIREEEQ